MEKAEWRTFACPCGCSDDGIIPMVLPQRQLFLCLCKSCKCMWFDGPLGAALVSTDELLSLQRMRTQYVRGELPV
ncbi:MAG TPA: hypothetical protein VKX16_17945 [Chloroflexota bacterium]|nr:hypothetical protein [Chloroflexota bacterium]